MTRRGMTLVEMLVAMTATLLLMAAIAQAFTVFGSAVTGTRGVLDVDARMRSAAWRLRSDLAGITVRPLPPIAPETAEGYLEIIEGPLTDFQDATTMPAVPIVTGVTPIGPTDVDDVLLFTTQSTTAPFVGRAPFNKTFESTLAEVAWFARWTPGTSNPRTYTLYRKQLLVLGYVGVAPFSSGSNNSVAWASRPSVTASWEAFYTWPCDVSVRREGNTLVPNTLADLSRREARFLHNVSGLANFPYAFVSHQSPTAPDGLTFDGTSRAGEDVVLTDVLAFDVRVFDPGAGVQVLGTTPLVPGDPSYVPTTAVDIGSGAYVDLGHGDNTNSVSAGMTPRFYDDQPRQVAGTSPDFTLTRTYDTWTTAYEANGRDEDMDGIIDQAFDGEDGDNNGLIDDPDEFETRPPYPSPLRGIEVRIRCYEPSSRQVRQVTVRHSFVPH